jgi:hypothetical protein
MAKVIRGTDQERSATHKTYVKARTESAVGAQRRDQSREVQALYVRVRVWGACVFSTQNRNSSSICLFKCRRSR